MKGNEIKSNRFAFTLIELLVVVVVISILVTIAIPRIQGMRDEANQVKALAETRALGAAIESYYLNQSPNAYPSSTETLCVSILNQAQPLIVSDVLIDPFLANNSEYQYIRSDNGQYYVVFSLGINGIADIRGVDNTGVLQGAQIDDLFWTNGTGF